MNEYKPGDIAWVTAVNRPKGYAAHRLRDGSWCELGETNAILMSPVSIRPLVVIDPEGDADVERLAEIYRNTLGANSSRRDDMAQTLREYANPKPVIEEPTKFAATVLDDSGIPWTRIAITIHDHKPWRSGDTGIWSAWDGIAVSSPDQIKFPGIES